MYSQKEGDIFMALSRAGKSANKQSRREFSRKTLIPVKISCKLIKFPATIYLLYFKTFQDPA